MSNQRYFTVLCDKCEAETTANEDGIREARATAKALGWKLGKQKDFCKSCAEQIKEAVKLAQSGNG